MNKLKQINRTSLVFSGLLLLLAVLVGVVFIARPSHEPTNKAAIAKNRAAKINLSDLTSSLKVDLISKYKSLESSGTSDGLPIIGYRYKQADYRIGLPNNYSFSLIDNASSNEDTDYNYYAASLSYISKYLQSSGFGRPEALNSQANLSSSTYFYKGRQTVCEVAMYQNLILKCDDLANLAKLSQADSTFAQAYLAASGDSLPTIISSQLTASQTAGFELAYVTYLDSSGQTKVYYYQPAGATWQMINLDWYNDPDEDGNVTPNCEDFSSIISVKQAFGGIKCYDSNLRQFSTL